MGAFSNCSAQVSHLAFVTHVGIGDPCGCLGCRLTRPTMVVAHTTLESIRKTLSDHMDPAWLADNVLNGTVSELRRAFPPGESPEPGGTMVGRGRS